MGPEPGRKRQHLLLYVASILSIVIGCLGCTYYPKMWQAQRELKTAEKYMMRGDYGAALKAGREALKKAPHKVKDEVLYQLAIICAHPDNPNRDYQEASEYLQSLIVDFPESTRKQEALLWIMVFREVINQKTKIRHCNESIRERDRGLGRLQRRLVRMKREQAELVGRIEKLKEIDLGIEERKRKALPQ